jgi:hypothetical protein
MSTAQQVGTALGVAVLIGIADAIIGGHRTADSIAEGLATATSASAKS